MLTRLDDEARAALSRTTFNDLFDILTTSDRSTWTRLSVSRRWNAVKALRKLAVEREWELKPEHIRRSFAVGVDWERHRRERSTRGETGEWDTPEREERRRQYLDELRQEVLDLDRSVKGARRDLELLAKYARVVLARDGDADVSLQLYRQALDARPPPSIHEHDASPFTPSPAASSFLLPLFRDDPRLAVSHLNTMLDGHHLPTTHVLQRTMRDQMPAPEDVYARAREVLDSACSSGGRTSQHELDRLMEERIKAADWEEMVETEPVLAFLRWLSEERPASDVGPSQDERTLAALRLWDGVYAQGAWDQPKSRESLAALEDLVKPFIPRGQAGGKISSPRSSAPLPRPSPAHIEAINLALKHLPPSLLLSLANRLLTSVTLYTHSPSLARHVYFSLRRLAPLDSAAPLQWHVTLRPLFISLVLSASSMNDSAFVIQLYLEWTASAMTYPKGMWAPIWRALGQRSDVDEVARIIGDYEEHHRERVAGYIVSHILIASASQPHYLRTLRLLDYLRERTPHPSIRAELGVQQDRIPLVAYNAILRRLAATYQDRRRDALAVFSHLVADGLTPHLDTWNALLAGQVFRPKFHIEDVDNAGAAYNALVRSGCEPDEMTYSLLLVGFLRLARSHEKRTVGLDSALNTFQRSLSEDKLVRGQQVAGLVRQLGVSQRWEEAKGVAEAWWRGVVVVQEREGASFGRLRPNGTGRPWKVEMREVEDSQRDLSSMESRRWVLSFACEISC